MVNAEKHEQYHRHTETIRITVWHVLAQYNLRSNISCFAKHSRTLAMRKYVITVAYQQVSSIGMYKKATIVQVLKRKSFSVKKPECLTQLDGSVQYCSERGETNLCQSVLTKLVIAFRLEWHDVAETAIPHLCYSLWPQKR